MKSKLNYLHAALFYAIIFLFHSIAPFYHLIYVNYLRLEMMKYGFYLKIFFYLISEGLIFAIILTITLYLYQKIKNSFQYGLLMSGIGIILMPIIVWWMFYLLRSFAWLYDVSNYIPLSSAFTFFFLIRVGIDYRQKRVSKSKEV